MGTRINLDNLLVFAPNVGVLLCEDSRNCSSEQLRKAVLTAFAHMDDELLVRACCGGEGPLSDLGEIPYSEYVIRLREAEQGESARSAKRIHTQIRRSEFNRSRSDLILAMLDNKVPYVCVETGCGTCEDLTVDHVIPISRGGTDTLGNLRFLCRSHNSRKADKSTGLHL